MLSVRNAVVSVSLATAGVAQASSTAYEGFSSKDMVQDNKSFALSSATTAVLMFRNSGQSSMSLGDLTFVNSAFAPTPNDQFVFGLWISSSPPINSTQRFQGADFVSSPVKRDAFSPLGTQDEQGIAQYQTTILGGTFQLAFNNVNAVVPPGGTAYLGISGEVGALQGISYSDAFLDSQSFVSTSTGFRSVSDNTGGVYKGLGANLTVVPEPTGLAGLAIGAGLLAGRRRRRAPSKSESAPLPNVDGWKDSE